MPRHTIRSGDEHGVGDIIEVECRYAVVVKGLGGKAAQHGGGVSLMGGFRLGGDIGDGIAVVIDVGVLRGRVVVGLIDAHPVDIHLRLITCIGQGRNLRGVVDAGVAAAHGEVEEEEERLVEIMTSAKLAVGRGDAEREVFGFTLLRGLITGEVVEHLEVVLIPDDGEHVVAVVLHRIVGRHGDILTHLLMVLVGGVGTIVQRTGEIAVLGTGGDAIGVTQLDDIHLAAFRPAMAVHVVAHHPIGRPQTVGGLRELDARLQDAVLEGGFALRGDAARGEALALIVFALGRQHEVAVGHSHILLAVILQLLVATAISVNLHVPDFLIERRTIEVVTPHQMVAAGGVGDLRGDLQACPYEECCQQRDRFLLHNRIRDNMIIYKVKKLLQYNLAAIVDKHALGRLLHAHALQVVPSAIGIGLVGAEILDAGRGGILLIEINTVNTHGRVEFGDGVGVDRSARLQHLRHLAGRRRVEREQERVGYLRRPVVAEAKIAILINKILNGNVNIVPFAIALHVADTYEITVGLTLVKIYLKVEMIALDIGVAKLKLVLGVGVAKVAKPEMEIIVIVDHRQVVLIAADGTEIAGTPGPLRGDAEHVGAAVGVGGTLTVHIDERQVLLVPVGDPVEKLVVGVGGVEVLVALNLVAHLGDGLVGSIKHDDILSGGEIKTTGRSFSDVTSLRAGRNHNCGSQGRKHEFECRMHHNHYILVCLFHIGKRR